MSKYSVVLVDDNAIFRMIFENIIKNIENIDIDFRSYENALDALDELKSSQSDNANCPDYLFVDINMPYMSGWQMMDKIQDEEYSYLQNAKIYIVSSSHLASDKDRINQYPFITTYIQKPINREHLSEILF